MLGIVVRCRVRWRGVAYRGGVWLYDDSGRSVYSSATFATTVGSVLHSSLDDTTPSKTESTPLTIQFSLAPGSTTDWTCNPERHPVYLTTAPTPTRRTTPQQWHHPITFEPSTTPESTARKASKPNLKRHGGPSSSPWRWSAVESPAPIP
ncbi:hypothetical protein K439DRAFT_1611254 [Ramaria rubella]|nr:hypothetical protein K439DRAFT_1611254 [Ramaria rubella]